MVKCVLQEPRACLFVFDQSDTSGVDFELVEAVPHQFHEQ